MVNTDGHVTSYSVTDLLMDINRHRTMLMLMELLRIHDLQMCQHRHRVMLSVVQRGSYLARVRIGTESITYG